MLSHKTDPGSGDEGGPPFLSLKFSRNGSKLNGLLSFSVRTRVRFATSEAHGGTLRQLCRPSLLRWLDAELGASQRKRICIPHAWTREPCVRRGAFRGRPAENATHRETGQEKQTHFFVQKCWAVDDEGHRRKISVRRTEVEVAANCNDHIKSR